MSAKDCCLFLRGEVYEADQTSSLSFGCNFDFGFDCPNVQTSPGRSLGNVQSLTINIDSEEKNKLVLDGNIYNSDCSTTIINSVTFSMRISCMSSQNLVRAFLGTSKTLSTPDPVVDQIHLPTENVKFLCGTCIFFDQVGVDVNTVIVKNSDNGTVYEVNKDYCVDKCGIELLKDFAFGVGIGLELSYSYDPSCQVTCIEGLTEEPKELSLIYKGKNIADGGSPFIVKLHKAKINPASALDLINDSDFAEIEISGTLQANKTTKDKSVSQYFNICKVLSA